MSVTYISKTLRNLVYKRAEGLCEYCLIHDEICLAKHQIDHVIAEKHGGLTTESNLALSCTVCNKFKGSDISSIDGETEEIVPLFNPRKHIWRAFHHRKRLFYRFNSKRQSDNQTFTTQ